jgi:RNA polymerase sigma-70 factor (ECF subfamily)
MSKFESTIWTIIKKVKQKDPVAVNEFVSRYREPVITFIIRQGFSTHDAEDIAQEVFLRVFKDEVLSKADKAKGRFRNLLLAVTKNVIRLETKKRTRQKRGGRDKMISLEEIIDDEGTLLKDIITADEKDASFDKLWILNIVGNAFEKLKKESELKGTPYFDAIELYLQQGSDYKIIAQKLGKSITEVRNYLYKARLKLRDYIREEIASYCSSQKEYEDELKYLSSYLDEI